MARGVARAVSFGRRATTGWCSYRRVTVAFCIGNLVAVLLVLRSLTAPASFAPTAPNREWNPSPCLRIRFTFFDLTRFVSGGEVVQYTEEQIRWVEESIRIRREAEPVELVLAVLSIDNSFTYLFGVYFDRLVPSTYDLVHGNSERKGKEAAEETRPGGEAAGGAVAGAEAEGLL
jgi:hypothetical protein